MPDLPTALPTTRIPSPLDAPGISWGVLAPGWIADRFTETLHRNTRSRVVAAGSRSVERAGQFAARHGVERSYGSYDQLLADPGIDAVYIASPHSHHHAHVSLALAAGKPVLVEKAFTQNAAQAVDLVATARAADLLLVEAMWTRFLPHTDVLRRLLADGALGELRIVAADHGQFFDVDASHRLRNPDLAGGALLDLGIYPVSFTSFVLGSPDDVVAAGELTDTGVDAQVSAVLRTGGAHGIVSTTQLAKTPTTAVIAGSDARIEIGGDFYTPQAISLVSRDGVTLTAGGGPLIGHEGLAYQAAHFATLLAERQVDSPLLPLDESVAIMRTLDEIRRQIGLVYPNER